MYVRISQYGERENQKSINPKNIRKRGKGTKNRRNIQKTTSKMVDINLNISIIILSGNGLNISIKKTEIGQILY